MRTTLPLIALLLNSSAGATALDYTLQSNTTATLASINGEAFHQLSKLHTSTVSSSTNPKSGLIDGSTSGAGVSYTYSGKYNISVGAINADTTHFNVDLLATASAAINYQNMPAQWDIHDGLFSSATVNTISSLSVNGIGSNNILKLVPSGAMPASVDVKYIGNGMKISTAVSAEAKATGSSSVSIPLNQKTTAASFDIVQTHQSLNDILKNSVKPLGMGPTMTASFSPSIPAAQVAALMNVDHFNWIQQVTHIPAGWSLSLVAADGHTKLADVIVDSSGNILPGGLVPSAGVHLNDKRLLDPTPYSKMGAQYRVSYPSGSYLVGDIPLGAIDDKPFVFGEDSSTKGFAGGVQDPMFVSASSLGYLDTPFLPAGLAGNNYYLGFSTKLAGVDDLGNEVQLPDGIGLGFTWETDAVTASVTGRLMTFDHGNGTPILSGGVFNVRSDAVAPVPELPTAPLLVMGGLVLASVWRGGVRSIAQRAER